MSIAISGYTCIRNGVALDYCFHECIQSMVPVCDEIVVGYRTSTDSTFERLQELCVDIPKLRIFIQDWDDPSGDTGWWTRWINDVRDQLKHPVQLMLDADEIIEDTPSAHARIKQIAESGKCAWFKRLNFVKDSKHLIPYGECCGTYVARLGPRQYWMPSDEPHPEGEPEIRRKALHSKPPIHIFHYGFVRRVQAFYHKVDAVNKIWFGRRDDRMDPFRAVDSEEWYTVADWGKRLDHYRGNHPRLAIPWLKERGRI